MKQILQGMALMGVGVASFMLTGLLPLSTWLDTLYANPLGELVKVKQVPLEGTISDYFKTNAFLHKTTLDIVNSLTTEEQAGMFFMPAWEKNETRSEFINRIQEYHVGGVMILRNDATSQDVAAIKQALTKEINGIKLEPFVSIDAEPSLMKYRLPQEGYTTQTSQLQSKEEAYQAGLDIGAILKGYGYNLNFAPIYDSGHNTTVIADRAFSNNEQEIIQRANAFAEATLERNIIPTAKHFPGHGYVSGDTHTSIQSIEGGIPELEVFARAVDFGIPMLMVGHLIIGEGEYATGEKPATLSATSSTKLLRNTLGFKGVSISDALVMGALDGFDDVDMMALEAGMDILLMPRTLETSYRAVLARLQQSSNNPKLTDKLYRIVRLQLVTQWAGN